MQFAVLGSGSRGNALLIKTKQTCVMLDNGFSVRETERRLAKLSVSVNDLSAIVVTHEHADHINGVGVLARKFNLPVYATRGTLSAKKLGELPMVNVINNHMVFEIEDVQLQAFPVPHDAREPCQFVFSDGKCRVAVLTDVGRSTVHIEEQISSCDALILECNHDEHLLAQGDYPYSVKQRVGGAFGHLNNRQAADVLNAIDTSRLQHIVAAHLSEKHNHAELAKSAISEALGCEKNWIDIADQAHGLAWRGVY
ncbi:MAG: MBL fold metallo-hydrolase [Gammaproteobacteria bacterium]|nr:MBL fold metallo-hydrolase [Gammaproteobacteria bacterium]